MLPRNEEPKPSAFAAKRWRQILYGLLPSLPLLLILFLHFNSSSFLLGRSYDLVTVVNSFAFFGAADSSAGGPIHLIAGYKYNQTDPVLRVAENESSEEQIISGRNNNNDTNRGDSSDADVNSNSATEPQEQATILLEHIPPPPSASVHPSPTLLGKHTRASNYSNYKKTTKKAAEKSSAGKDCEGRYIYAHDIPQRFNVGILRDCRSIFKWTDMCRYVTNSGLGPRMVISERPNRGWFETDQFSLEVVFHNRMKQYECLTSNSSQASAIFVPFYAGLDVARHLWGSTASARDSVSLDLLKWVSNRPEWRRMGGKDHFMVAGRIAWDFRRTTDQDSDWGSKLLFLPEAQNMTTLLLESSLQSDAELAIPYPTYFHPSSDREVFLWQAQMRKRRRRFLYSFAGAPRPTADASIRGEIIDQCRASRRRCNLLSCGPGGKGCWNPAAVMRAFQSSVYCLQPSGDSYTRRSTFDCILAGCIPVFFHPGSAYQQYTWHLPRNHTKYSVYIPEEGVKQRRVSIDRVLQRISRKEVAAMREEVIRLIPRIVYADPRYRLETLKDAFDIAVEGVLDRVGKMRVGSNLSDQSTQ